MMLRVPVWVSRGPEQYGLPAAPRDDFWLWPLFPFWTHNGWVRLNWWRPWRVRVWRGGECEMPGEWWDRPTVTYYRPRCQQVVLAEELFPWHGANVPWRSVFDELLRDIPSVKIRELKCYDALALLAACRARRAQAWLPAPMFGATAAAPQPATNPDIMRELTAAVCLIGTQTIDNARQLAALDKPPPAALDQPKPAEKPEAEEGASQNAAVSPTGWIHGWRGIVDALGIEEAMPTERYQVLRRKIAILNRTFHGPIVIGRRGSQPLVERGKLLAWWNGLAEKVRSQSDRQRDAEATAGAQHPYGARGIVAPDLAGEVRYRP